MVYILLEDDDVLKIIGNRVEEGDEENVVVITLERERVKILIVPTFDDLSRYPRDFLLISYVLLAKLLGGESKEVRERIPILKRFFLLILADEGYYEKVLRYRPEMKELVGVIFFPNELEWALSAFSFLF